MRLAPALAAAIAAAIAGWAAHPPIGAGPVAFLVVPLFLGAVALSLPDPRSERGCVRDRGSASGPGVGTRTAIGPSASWRGPALVGLVTGLATFLPMTPWIIEPAGYVGWVLLALVQAAWYTATALVVTPWVRSPWVVLVAPLVWAGMEVWRGSIPLGGFGWGELGYAHADTAWVLPLARVTGVHGLTVFTALVGAVAYLAVVRLPVRGLSRWPARTAAATAVAVVVAVAVPGVAGPAAPPPTGDDLDVLAVQGNNLETFAGSARAEDIAIAERMIAETRKSVERHGTADLTIWPESSIDRDPFTSTGDYLLPYAREGAEVAGGNLLFGVNLDGPRPAETFRNSAMLVDQRLREIDRYTKRRYVPFGEYVPFRSVLGRLPPLQQVPRDGIPGDVPQTVVGDDVRVAVIICYETLFPDIVRTNVLAENADLVVAVTNDAAFGRSWESRQHITQSRLRAVESGRWLVHAALSGQSALIDPDGRVVELTEHFTRATIRASVPVVSATTPFLRIGDVAGHLARWGSLALVIVLLGRWLVGRRRPGAEENE